MNMETLLRGLGIGAGAQLLLAAITWWPSGGGATDARDLVPVAAEDLAKITIYDRVLRGEVHDDPLVLEQKDGEWLITSTLDYPADPANMTTLMETIDKLQARRPVATRAYHHQSMDVAEDEHSRKLVLETSEGKAYTFFVGSAQGNAAHVRVEGDDNVYKIRGVSSAIPERATRYFNRDFQRVDVGRVRSLTIERPGEAPINFVYDGTNWSLPNLTPEGKVVDQFQARTFVQSTLNLRMTEPHGKTATPAMGLDATGTKVSWLEQEEDGTSLAGEYYVGAEVPEQSGRVYLKSSTSPYVFEALKGQLQHARERGIDDLFTDPAPEAPPPDEFPDLP